MLAHDVAGWNADVRHPVAEVPAGAAEIAASVGIRGAIGDKKEVDLARFRPGLSGWRAGTTECSATRQQRDLNESQKYGEWSRKLVFHSLEYNEVNDARMNRV